MQAYPAKRLDLVLGDVAENLIEFFQRGIALKGIEGRSGGLNQDQRFAHGLFAGTKVSEQRISSATFSAMGHGSDPTTEATASCGARQ